MSGAERMCVQYKRTHENHLLELDRSDQVTHICFYFGTCKENPVNYFWGEEGETRQAWFFFFMYLFICVTRSDI